MRYYLWTDGVESGPLEEADFLERFRNGRLPTGTLARSESSKKFSTPDDVWTSIAERREILQLHAALPEVKAAMVPPMNTAGNGTGQDVLEAIGFLMLAVGLLTCVGALMYDTAPGGTHNIGLISNREAIGIFGVGMATCGGLLVIAARIGRLQDKVVALRGRGGSDRSKGG